MAEARVPILDRGFLRSDATYDVAHVWRGSFFRLEDHLDRFERGMTSLLSSPQHHHGSELIEGMRLASRDGTIPISASYGSW